MCESGSANYLVTGDKTGLLNLESHGHTAIITARSFLDLIAG
jgi:predicted nucleic acid-binding protein